jgi:ABC-2 type transport system ATP-binding protein
VNDVSLTVPEGSVCGLLGPNGAGKTTILKILIGLVSPGGGSAEVLGHDVREATVEIRREAAFVPEDKTPPASMRAREFVRFYLAFFAGSRVSEANEWLASWGIDVRKRIRSLSRADRARVLLAAVIARHPRLLLIDEPTEGLDPESIEQMISWMTEAAAREGQGALIATNHIEEVERACDRVAILRQGRLLLEGEIDELRSRWKRIHVWGASVEVRGVPDVRCVEVSSEGVLLTTDRYSEAQVARLREAGARAIDVHDMNLREIYLAVQSDGARA